MQQKKQMRTYCTTERMEKESQKQKFIEKYNSLEMLLFILNHTLKKFDIHEFAILCIWKVNLGGKFTHDIRVKTKPSERRHTHTTSEEVFGDS